VPGVSAPVVWLIVNRKGDGILPLTQVLCRVTIYLTVDDMFLCVPVSVDCVLSDYENSDDGQDCSSDSGGESEDVSRRKSLDGKLIGSGSGSGSGIKKTKRLNKSATEFLTKWLIDHQGV
jgi:hypothetical protein